MGGPRQLGPLPSQSPGGPKPESVTRVEQVGACSLLTPAHLPWQWCEKHKRSGRQMLGDLLIKPHQRITKYPLLLQAVLKRSPEARTREALNAMVGGLAGLVSFGVGGWCVGTALQELLRVSLLACT